MGRMRRDFMACLRCRLFKAFAVGSQMFQIQPTEKFRIAPASFFDYALCDEIFIIIFRPRTDAGIFHDIYFCRVDKPHASIEPVHFFF